MRFFSDEQFVVERVESEISHLKDYFKTLRGNPNYRDFHKSIKLDEKFSDGLRFDFLTKKFLILPDYRITQSVGFLRTYIMVYDMNDYPKMILEQIPDMDVRVDMIGAVRFAVGGTDGNFMEQYVLRLTKYISDLERGDEVR